MQTRTKSSKPSKRTEPDEAKASRPPAGGAGESQYEIIFNQLPHAAWVLDRATLRILAVNEAAISLYEYSREEFLTMTYPDLCLSEDAMDVFQKLGQYSHSRGTSAWHQRQKSEKIIRVHARWCPVPFDRVPAILMILESTPLELRRLIQETEEGRRRLESLSRRLVQVQEAERSEIARELHDEIGQLLTGLKLLVASETHGWGGNGDGTKTGEITAIVNELIGRLRDLSTDLRPPMLDEIGLVSTLHWYFGRFTERTSVRVSFRESIGKTRFPATVEIAAFRIIQEALTNVARHAGTDEVQVDIQSDTESLKLLIEDSGRGFNPRMVSPSHSAGIIGMQERVNLLGGHFSLESAIAAGTRIVVALPLPLIEGGGGQGKDHERNQRIHHHRPRRRP